MINYRGIQLFNILFGIVSIVLWHILDYILCLNVCAKMI